jgi:hypothetical protein
VGSNVPSERRFHQALTFGNIVPAPTDVFGAPTPLISQGGALEREGPISRPIRLRKSSQPYRNLETGL